MPIDRKDLPSHVRRCWQAAKKANLKNREAETERLKFYVGGDYQWRDEELERRRNSGRTWVTINKCKPAVDQIEGDIRLNPPGPEVHPLGGGSDGDTADIMEGLIRETEYRCDGKTAYSTAGKYSAASGYGVLELGTEYENDRSRAQRMTISSVEDPASCFFDPHARKANRQDAMWAGKLRMYSREDYIATFGKNRRVLQPSGLQQAKGWIAEALGLAGDAADLNEWTGAGKGPFYVAEFYQVELTPTKVTRYSDNITRFEGEPVPKHAKPLAGEENTWTAKRRKITKSVVDAMETIDETDWLGSIIPLIPVLGPEVYIDGKLHRLSLIAPAIDSQRALNYVATTMTELAGMMPKSPWVGWKGQFNDSRWQTANSEMWAYLEVEPVYGTDDAGKQSLLPAPQRNLWEAPIQWLLALGAYFSDAIKATTAIYDPSLGQQKGDQSGKAIEQLRSESNVGNFSYADNLHRAIGVMYQQMVEILPQIMDGPRVAAIVKPDSKHEMVTINMEFNESTGKYGKNGSSSPKDITQGSYAVRAKVGPSFETSRDEALEMMMEFFKVAPQTLGAPGVAGRVLRLLGRGNHQVEEIADLLDPRQDGDVTPQQMQAQLQQATAQNQALMQAVQKLNTAIQTKAPELEVQKYIAELKAATDIRKAEITASKDLDKAAGEREASLLETQIGLAHDAAQQAVQHEHEASQQQGQQQAAAQAQASDQAHAAESQASDQQAAQQQQQANQGEE